MEPEYQGPLNRRGRRAEIAMARKEPLAKRKFSYQTSLMHQERQRREGLAYRIAKVRGDVSAMRVFERKHPKLKVQFRRDNVLVREKRARRSSFAG